MKKNQIKALSICSLIAVSLTLLSAGTNDDTITKENDMFVVNTTTIGKNIEGYNGPTPLKIYIKKNKVVKIEALKNAETPKYYAKVKKALLEKWNGLKVKEASQLKVDAVTGATYSSEAVMKNVRLGLEYYQSHK